MRVTESIRVTRTIQRDKPIRHFQGIEFDQPALTNEDCRSLFTISSVKRIAVIASPTRIQK